MSFTGSISVVICAHTGKRWHETIAAVESVRAQACPAWKSLSSSIIIRLS